MFEEKRFQIVSILGSILLSILVLGCNSEVSTEGSEGNDKQFLTVGTAKSSGGAFFIVGNGIANAVNNNKGDKNWVVTSSVTKGTQENIRKLESGEIQFGMGNAAIAYFAARGEGKWKQPHEVCVVANMAPNVGVFVTTKGTNIKTIQDLKGRRVVLGPSGAGFEYFLKPLLEAHGVTYEDMTPISGDFNSAGGMLADGKADAAFMGGAVPIPAVVSLCQAQDVVFVEMDSAVLDHLKEYPFYFGVNIPADKYSDLDEELFGINVGNMQLLSHAKVDEETVYQFTKLLYENREEVVKMHPAGKALNEKNIAKDTGVPYHPGAIKFYKEVGIWKNESEQLVK